MTTRASATDLREARTTLRAAPEVAPRPGAASADEGYQRGRVPRAVRERQVLAAAEELFVERGYAGTSMDELARRVGVSKPVIYDLVGSKEQVFGLAIERATQDMTSRIAAAAAGSSTLGGRIHAGAVAFFEFVAEHRRAWHMLLSGAAAAGEGGAEIAAARRRSADHIAAVLIDAAAPEVPDAVLVDALAHAVNGAFEAAATWWQGHDEVSADTLATWTTSILVPGLAAMLRTTAPPDA